MRRSGKGKATKRKRRTPFLRPLLIVLVLISLPSILKQFAGSTEDTDRQRELAAVMVDYRNAKNALILEGQLSQDLASQITSATIATADRLDQLATGTTASDVVARVFAEQLREGARSEANYYDLSLEFASLVEEFWLRTPTRAALEREIEVLEAMIESRKDMLDIARSIPDRTKSALLRNGFSRREANSTAGQISDAYRLSKEEKLAKLDLDWLDAAKEVAELLLHKHGSWEIVNGYPEFASDDIAQKYDAAMSRLSDLEQQQEQVFIGD